MVVCSVKCAGSGSGGVAHCKSVISGLQWHHGLWGCGNLIAVVTLYPCKIATVANLPPTVSNCFQV
jgi:hypothetical protein